MALPTSGLRAPAGEDRQGHQHAWTPTSSASRRSRTRSRSARPTGRARRAAGRRAQRGRRHRRAGPSCPRRRPPTLPPVAYAGRHPQRASSTSPQVGTGRCLEGPRRLDAPSPTPASRSPRPSSRSAPALTPRSRSSSTTSSPRAASTPAPRRQRQRPRAPSTVDRTRQATASPTSPTRSPPSASVEAVFLTGDFNSYTKEDPMQVLDDAGYTDRVRLADPATTPTASAASRARSTTSCQRGRHGPVTGADIWKINADESVAYQYSRYNYNATHFHAADPFAPPTTTRRSSASPPRPGRRRRDQPPQHQRLPRSHRRQHHGVRRRRSSSSARRAATPTPCSSLPATTSARRCSPPPSRTTTRPRRAGRAGAGRLGGGQPRVRPGLRGPRDDVIPGMSTSPTWAPTSTRRAPPTPVLDEYDTFEVDGITVGVIGVVTEETPRSSAPAASRT